MYAVFCLFGCCICFTHVLQVFYLDVAKCFCKCFRRMFQVFHVSFLYVASVASGCFKNSSGVSYGMKCERCERSPRTRGAGDVPAARAHRGCARRKHGPTRGRAKTDCCYGCPDTGVCLDIRTLAVSLYPLST